MWELYDKLIEEIDPEARVAEMIIGGYRCLLITADGRGGLASLLSRGMKPAAPALLAQYRGRRLREVAALVKSWDDLEAACGMAAINAQYNHLPRLRGLQAQIYPPGTESGDIFELMLPRCRGKKVATVGHFSPAGALYAPVCEFTVFEREPRPGDLPDAAAEYLLPEMEVVFITGMTLTNKTLPRLLQLARDAFIVITGPSVPLTPALHAFGVDLISGFAIADLEKSRRAALSTAAESMYRYGHKVILP